MCPDASIASDALLAEINIMDHVLQEEYKDRQYQATDIARI